MNKQRKVIENKQRLPPFSPLPLCANSGNAANIRNCTNHQDRELQKITRIESFKKSPGSKASKLQTFSPSSLSNKISPPPPHFVGILASCRPLPVNIGLKHLILCSQKPATSSLQHSPSSSVAALCSPATALSATKNFGKKEAALPSTDPDPQKVSICPSYASLLSS